MIAVEQRGDGAACHEGYESCFFRVLDQDADADKTEWKIVDNRKVDPAKYGPNYGHHAKKS